MARYLLIKDGIIQNALELEDGNYTSSFMQHINGSKFPTAVINGQVVLTNQYLIPEGFELVRSDIGEINGQWPIPEPQEKPTNQQQG